MSSGGIQDVFLKQSSFYIPGMRERKLQGSWSEDPINIELSFTEMGKLVRENSLKVRIICSLLGMLCLR